MTEAIVALAYDPSKLSVSAADIKLGSLPMLGAGWQLDTVVDQTSGQIGIVLYSTNSLTATGPGSLVDIAFHVRPGVGVTATGVQLVHGVMASGQQFTTQVDDAQGQLVLTEVVSFQAALPMRYLMRAKARRA